MADDTQNTNLSEENKPTKKSNSGLWIGLALLLIAAGVYFFMGKKNPADNTVEQNIVQNTIESQTVSQEQTSAATSTQSNNATQEEAEEAAPAAPQEIPEEIPEFENVLFIYNAYDFQGDAKKRIDAVYNYLSKHADKKILLSGHTDDRGDKKYNMSLSTLRVEAVKNYFVSKGIKEERIVLKSYGEDRPAATNKTREGRGLNRRVELVAQD